MDNKEICPVFKAYRTHKVAKQKPAPVLIYDYYDNCKQNIKFPKSMLLNYIFFSLARRATQFYKAKQADLCDICDGEECGEACKIKAQKRISVRSEKSQTEDSSAQQSDSKGQSNKMSSPVTILIVVAIMKITNLF